MPLRRPIEFAVPGGNVLTGRIVTPTMQPSPAPVVLMVPGDGAEGIEGKTWTRLPDRLAARGVASFLFDFEGIGQSQGKRRELTLTVGLADVRAAMGALATQPDLDPTRVGIFGSSFGGNVAVLYAGENPSLRCMGLKSPVSFLADAFLRTYGADRLREWAGAGYLDEIGYDYRCYLDAFQHNTYAAASRATCPCLITHGDADPSVPLSQSMHLHAALGSRDRELRIFGGTGHDYSAPGEWERMADAFVAWFATHLGPGTPRAVPVNSPEDR